MRVQKIKDAMRRFLDEVEPLMSKDEKEALLISVSVRPENPANEDQRQSMTSIRGRTSGVHTLLHGLLESKSVEEQIVKALVCHLKGKFMEAHIGHVTQREQEEVLEKFKDMLKGNDTNPNLN